MLKTLILISALTFGSFAAARADGITGNFTLSGTDAYTTTTLNFGSAVIGAAGSGPVTGTFATYLTNGTTVDFYPGTLFYANGSNVVSPAFQLFTVTENGETFTFDLSDYTAVYTSGTNLFGTFTNHRGWWRFHRIGFSGVYG